MTDKTILKLITSSIEEDVVIGANYLIKRPLQDIISFYDRYGESFYSYKEPGNHFYSKKRITVNYKVPYMKVIKDNYLIWVGGEKSYLLNPNEYTEQIDSWEDKTI